MFLFSLYVGFGWVALSSYCYLVLSKISARLLVFHSLRQGFFFNWSQSCAFLPALWFWHNHPTSSSGGLWHPKESQLFWVPFLFVSGHVFRGLPRHIPCYGRGCSIPTPAPQCLRVQWWTVNARDESGWTATGSGKKIMQERVLKWLSQTLNSLCLLFFSFSYFPFYLFYPRFLESFSKCPSSLLLWWRWEWKCLEAGHESEGAGLKEDMLPHIIAPLYKRWWAYFWVYNLFRGCIPF